VDAAYTILGLMCIEIWCRQFLGYWPGEAAATAGIQTALTA